MVNNFLANNSSPNNFATSLSTSSFTEYLFTSAPQLIPERLSSSQCTTCQENDAAPHGTTIVAVTYHDGVLIAGDRRATMGHQIANHLMRKVFIIDDYTAVGFAGTVGIALEILRLYSVELEYYEKIEGRSLSFSGKVNKLAEMVRRNFPNVQLGLVVAPLLVGYDQGSHQPQLRDITDADVTSNSDYYRGKGKIVSFDVLGSRYEEIAGYYAVGSGSVFARSALKKTYRKDMNMEQALTIAVGALMDAAEDDSATGGPDAIHRRYPLAIFVDKDGAQEVPEDIISRIVSDFQRNADDFPDHHYHTNPEPTQKASSPRTTTKTGTAKTGTVKKSSASRARTPKKTRVDNDQLTPDHLSDDSGTTSGNKGDSA